MPSTNLSHDELERWHYANGNVQAAALHAFAADGEAALEEAESGYQGGYDAGYQAGVETSNAELDDEIADLKDRIEELENPSA